VEKFCARSFGRYFYNCSTIFPQFFPAAPAGRGTAKSFYNSSTILSRVEKFGASGWAWRRIVEGIFVEELWKHLVNAAPDPLPRHQRVREA
jgi:hypothetical protein